jgi:hypothetical protein
MCRYGTLKRVKVINREQSNKEPVVDACIANEIDKLNKYGVITVGCCCGHGLEGEINEHVNSTGKWRQQHDPPHTLIDEKSVDRAKELGYIPFPYYYADGSYQGVWQMYLKTGCITMEDVEKWHESENEVSDIEGK